MRKESDFGRGNKSVGGEGEAAQAWQFGILAFSESGKYLTDDAIDAIIPERLKKQLPRFTKRHRHERLERV